MTYRERRLAKAERLREWAGKREAKAGALREIGKEYRHDLAFITQPGRIPERERMNARDERAREHNDKAADMASRADGIEAQAARAIYDDDPDAIEQLEEKIAKLTERADQQKRTNAAWRKGPEALAALGLSDAQIQTMTETMRLCPWMKVPLDTTHDRANIRRLKQRLEHLRSPQKQGPRALTVKYGGDCRTCGGKIERGEFALYWKAERELEHDACYQREEATA